LLTAVGGVSCQAYDDALLGHHLEPTPCRRGTRSRTTRAGRRGKALWCAPSVACLPPLSRPRMPPDAGNNASPSSSGPPGGKPPPHKCPTYFTAILCDRTPWRRTATGKFVTRVLLLRPPCLSFLTPAHMLSRATSETVGEGRRIQLLRRKARYRRRRWRSGRPMPARSPALPPHRGCSRSRPLGRAVPDRPTVPRRRGRAIPHAPAIPPCRCLICGSSLQGIRLQSYCIE